MNVQTTKSGGAGCSPWPLDTRTSAPVVTAQHAVTVAGRSPATGVDWSNVLRQLFFTEGHPFGQTERERYAVLSLAGLLPSGAEWWSVGHVGPAGALDLAAARRDLDWLEAVEREAAALGLQLGMPADDVGERLCFTATLAVALATPAGALIVNDAAGDVAATNE